MSGPVNRGSTQKIVAIKEATAGTTPATPTMIELPVSNWSPSFDNGFLKSAQIRSHPFVDKMIQGAFTGNIAMDFELQGATHDIVFETFFGGTITTKSLNFLDALKSLTIEEQVGGGSSLFDQYTYCYLSSLSITCGAGDTTPIKVSAGGQCRTATLDAGATIATAVTNAGNPDPYTFIGAGLTLGGSAADVTSATINWARKVDPLRVWGNRNPREYVPSDAL